MSLVVAADLEKAVRIQREGSTRVPRIFRELGREEFLRDTLFPNFVQVCAFMEKWRGRPLAADFESTYFDEVMCLGLWPLENCYEEDGLNIPFLLQGGVPYWSDPAEALHVRRLISEFLGAAWWPKIGQNWVGFDELLAHRAFGVRCQGCLLDTMVAHHLVMPELPHGLAFLSSVFTDLGPYKREVHEAAQDEKDDVLKFANVLNYDSLELYHYCVLDAFATSASANELIPMMEAA